MSNVFETHGAFSWAELMTTDTVGAKQFYGQLFGWTFEDMPMEDGEMYNVVMLGEEKVAGIMAMPAQAEGVPPHWGNYITVTDVDAIASKVTELGGTICVPPTDIPNVGRFTMFQDPQGATISAIQYAHQ
ncbi:MAG: VOC family protein [Kangiellaceae bacterium]|nr:VOC family protein [Kangiellaceae bacterium]